MFVCFSIVFFSRTLTLGEVACREATRSINEPKPTRGGKHGFIHRKQGGSLNGTHVVGIKSCRFMQTYGHFDGFFLYSAVCTTSHPFLNIFFLGDQVMVIGGLGRAVLDSETERLPLWKRLILWGDPDWIPNHRHPKPPKIPLVEWFVWWFHIRKI